MSVSEEATNTEISESVPIHFCRRQCHNEINTIFRKPCNVYTTQNLLRITFSFNDLMLKTNRLKKDFFGKDRLIFGLDDPVANMSIRHVYYA